MKMLPILGFVVSASALSLITLTMFMRANDQRYKTGLRWNARLLGFVLAGCAPPFLIWYTWATALWPSVWEVIFHVGLALVFMTTPGQPPWMKWFRYGDEKQ